MDYKRIKIGSAIFQKDRRVRIPKQAQESLKLVGGETEFEIFLDADTDEIILRPILETRNDGHPQFEVEK